MLLRLPATGSAVVYTTPTPFTFIYALDMTMQTGKRPAFTLSWAQTLDGRLATRSGSSQWISGDASLLMTHRLRAAHDAIMVGSGTVRADDPRLTVRLPEGERAPDAPQPLRIIVDSHLSISADARVLTDGASAGTLLATSAGADATRMSALRALGADVLQLPSADAHIDLQVLAEQLAARGIRSVMVEGGAGLLTALLRARLADRLVVTIAPKLLGEGIAAVGDLGLDDLQQAGILRDPVWTQYGVDMVLDGVLQWP